MKLVRICLIAGMIIMALGGIGGVMLAGYTFVLRGG